MSEKNNLSLSDKESNEPCVQQWGHSQSKLHNVHFTWTIQNFSFYQQKCNVSVQSPTFSADTNEEVKWNLRLYPNGQNEKVKDWLSIFLVLLSEPNKSQVFAKLRFSILNVNSRNEQHISKSQEACNFTVDRSLGFDEFIKRSILTNNSGLLPVTDKLTIICQVSFFVDTDVVNVCNPKSTNRQGQFKIHKCELTDDFGNLLDNPKFSDVTLVVGDREFPAHRGILAARSDVFAAMFEHEMEERKSGRVTITDVDPEVLQEMLRFIYTGDAPKIKEMANGLLTAADKYSLQKLKVMSEEALLSQLSIDSAAEILTLAHLHNADQLKEQAIQFINTHALGIIKTNGWKTMQITHEHLTIETLQALVMLNIK